MRYPRAGLISPEEVHKIVSKLPSGPQERLYGHILALTRGCLDWSNHGRFKEIPLADPSVADGV